MAEIKMLFTGGGSAGHVIPNLALISTLKHKGVSIFYIGSKQGIERSLIEPLSISYRPITTGKLHRYWSWKNFLIPFQLITGILQSFLIIKQLQPHIVFSKGGFVSLPVVFAAWLNRVPIVAHESDLVPGLANRMSIPFTKLIFVTFPETVLYLKGRTEVLVAGMPTRESLYQGCTQKGLKLCGFTCEKPVLLVMGGGLGSADLNESIRRLIMELTECFQVVHLCGRNKCDPNFDKIVGYKQFDYLKDDLAHVLACADLVVSRAGATAVYELLSLAKPHILIPLSKKASRGDQVDNATYFHKKGLSKVIYPVNFSEHLLMKTILNTFQNREKMRKKLIKFKKIDSLKIISDKLMSMAQ